MSAFSSCNYQVKVLPQLPPLVVEEGKDGEKKEDKEGREKKKGDEEEDTKKSTIIILSVSLSITSVAAFSSIFLACLAWGAAETGGKCCTSLITSSAFSSSVLPLAPLLGYLLRLVWPLLLLAALLLPLSAAPLALSLFPLPRPLWEAKFRKKSAHSPHGASVPVPVDALLQVL